MRKYDHISYLADCAVIGLTLIGAILLFYGAWLVDQGSTTIRELFITVAIPLVFAVVIAFIDFWRTLPCKTK